MSSKKRKKQMTRSRLRAASGVCALPEPAEEVTTFDDVLVEDVDDLIDTELDTPNLLQLGSDLLSGKLSDRQHIVAPVVADEAEVEADIAPTPKESKYYSRSVDNTVLSFTPTAWAKICYLRDIGDTEVSFFGISAADDLLCVEDVVLPAQKCSGATTDMDDDSIADLFDDQIDLGRRPEQFGRIWIHTHPGMSTSPSRTDEETFKDVFGKTNWSVMVIVNSKEEVFARLSTHVSPGLSIDLNTVIDYSKTFEGSQHAQWKAEYDKAVTKHYVCTQVYGKTGKFVVGGNWDNRTATERGSDRSSSKFDKSTTGNSWYKKTADESTSKLPDSSAGSAKATGVGTWSDELFNRACQGDHCAVTTMIRNGQLDPVDDAEMIAELNSANPFWPVDNDDLRLYAGGAEAGNDAMSLWAEEKSECFEPYDDERDLRELYSGKRHNGANIL